MENKELIEGNRLIAIFCGYREIKGWDGYEYGYTLHPTINVGCIGDMELKYHFSWDWLMPVVEKIEALSDKLVEKIYVSIDGKKCAMWNYFDPTEVLRVRDSNSTMKFRKIADSKLSATWLCCVDFIKWYNS